MTCPTCSKDCYRLVIRRGRKYCENCSHISTTGGANVSGILTRNSERVKVQHEKHKGDVVIPHAFDKVSGKVIPNPDFVKLYPEQTATYFDKEDVERSGDKRLVDLWDKQTEAKIVHEKSIEELTHGSRDVKGDKEKREKIIEAL